MINSSSPSLSTPLATRYGRWLAMWMAHSHLRHAHQPRRPPQWANYPYWYHVMINSSSFDAAGDEIWTLARNVDGTYTSANAVNHDLPATLTSPLGITGMTFRATRHRQRLDPEIWTQTVNVLSPMRPAQTVTF